MREILQQLMTLYAYVRKIMGSFENDEITNRMKKLIEEACQLSEPIQTTKCLRRGYRLSLLILIYM